MYRREKSLVLKSSSSALTNNLSIQVNLEKSLINYAVVHKSVINLVSATTDGSTVNHRQVVCKEQSSHAQGNVMVLQCRIVELRNKSILVIASQKGIQMYDSEGTVLLYYYAVGGESEDGGNFTRGICSLMGDTVCVGTSDGNILAFDVPTRGTNITLASTIEGDGDAVCDLQSAGEKLIATYDSGSIVVWKMGGDGFSQVLRIKGSGYPCTSLKIWQEAIVAGYGDGHIRVYSLSTGAKCVDIAAHSRWVSSVDIAGGSGLVLTTSEDSYVRVWQLQPDSGSFTMTSKFSESIQDIQLQGGQFIHPSGRAFGVTGYDSNELWFFSQS